MTKTATARALVRGIVPIVLVAGFALAYGAGVHRESVRAQEEKVEATISAARATEIAIGSAKEKFAAKGVSGSALDFGRATATRQNENWIVSIPELQPRARPNGLTLVVDARTGKCHPLIVE